ncbi:hypothetical protein [Muricoccus radiodurans]|uniref:hypothetical protein n=1 Tax=Muricoccus radiodurans TaxID=2231721 RepID=UPI003CF87C1A
MHTAFRCLSACLILLLPGCLDANSVALGGASAADRLADLRERQIRVFPQGEAAVLAAARAVAEEDGYQVVVDAPTIGVVGGLNRRDMSDGQIAGQVAVGIALAVLLGPGAGGRIVARTDARCTLVTQPVAGGGTRLRVSLDLREQQTNGQESVTIIRRESVYQGFLDRVTARLAGQPAPTGRS